MDDSCFDNWTLLSRPILFADLFSGALADYGVREHVSEHSTEDKRCLTDGDGLLWAVRGDAGLTDHFVPDASPSEFPLNIPLAVEHAFEVDVWPDAMADLVNERGWSWERTLCGSVEERSSRLCAEILAYLWNPKKRSGPSMRMDLAREISRAKGSTPRSLDDVARLVCKVTMDARPSSARNAWNPLRWDPFRKVAGLATLTWISQEIGRDEFLVAWLDPDSEARAALPHWGRRVDERFNQGIAERIAHTKSAKGFLSVQTEPDETPEA